MSYKIYLVEDDKNLNLVLTTYLEKEGWNITSFLTGREAQSQIPNPPDLWILDIMLPDIDGYQLIREIKVKTPNIPVIFISARDADIDRVVGLELGSDDYLAKPFLPRELVIRARNLNKKSLH
jgi:two-component system response regulator CssR